MAEGNSFYIWYPELTILYLVIWGDGFHINIFVFVGTVKTINNTRYFCYLLLILPDGWNKNKKQTQTMQVLLLDGNLNISSLIDNCVKQKKYHLCNIIMSICVYYNALIVAGGWKFLQSKVTMVWLEWISCALVRHPKDIM